mmetsp:Transcript_91973/g.162338  ORF Transcript_91973/g.162338 Transcript_91973/m.162338 type:complete len:223 (-) Transcript_91973:641-1309(-)
MITLSAIDNGHVVVSACHMWVGLAQCGKLYLESLVIVFQSLCILAMPMVNHCHLIVSCRHGRMPITMQGEVDLQSLLKRHQRLLMSASSAQMPAERDKVLYSSVSGARTLMAHQPAAKYTFVGRSCIEGTATLVFRTDHPKVTPRLQLATMCISTWAVDHLRRGTRPHVVAEIGGCDDGDAESHSFYPVVKVSTSLAIELHLRFEGVVEHGHSASKHHGLQR